MRPLLCHAFVNPLRGYKWKFSWQGYDLAGISFASENQNFARRPTQVID
jgi:hypothetical protein